MSGSGSNEVVHVIHGVEVKCEVVIVIHGVEVEYEVVLVIHGIEIVCGVRAECRI